MTSEVRWLKVGFLAGAIADALIAVLMLVPSRMGETEFRYPMGLASTVVLGWTCLLIWGYRRPVERKGLLVITIFPVITGLMANGVYQAAIGTFSFGRILPTLLLGVVLIALMGFGLVNSARCGSGGDDQASRAQRNPT